MTVKSNYSEGIVEVIRNDKVVKTYKLTEFVSAAEYAPIQKQMQEQRIRDEKEQPIKTAEENEINNKWFKAILPLAIQDFNLEEEKKVLSLPEISQLAAECYIFLANWSSTSEAKQFATALAEIQKKEKEDKSLTETSENTS